MFRILAVNSEPIVLQAFKEWLQADTLEIETARTGQQGLELARHFRPNAVILDLHLPDMGGMDLLDRLRELDPRLPVTLIMAYPAATETVVEAMKRGAFDWLLKPVNCPQLRAAVQRALQRGPFWNVPIAFREMVHGKVGKAIVGQAQALPEPHRAVAAVPDSFAPVASPSWLAGLIDFTQEMLREGDVDIYQRVCLEMDRAVLSTVLGHVQGNQVKASEMLGISRTTLRAKLRELKLAGKPDMSIPPDQRRGLSSA